MKRATLLVLLLLAAESALALEGLRTFRQNEWVVSTKANYLYSDANYTGSGSQNSLPNSGKYQLLDTLLGTRFVFTPEWAVMAGANVGYAESKSADATRSNSSFNWGTLGLEFTSDMGGFELIPEFSFVYPFEKNTSTQDSVMNSEGVIEARAILHAQAAFEGFDLFGSLGYSWRDQGRSSLMPWSAGAEFGFRSFSFGAKVFGFQTLKDDDDTGTTKEGDRQNTLLRVNAGSLKFYGLNPNLVDTEAYFKFNWNRALTVQVSGGLTVAGVRSAMGYHGGVELLYRFNTTGVRRRLLRPANPSDTYREEPSHQFKEDTDDGVDQRIFKPLYRPQPPPPKPVQQTIEQPHREDGMTIQLKPDPSVKKKRKKKK